MDHFVFPKVQSLFFYNKVVDLCVYQKKKKKEGYNYVFLMFCVNVYM
jgi:hypothetical protein